MKCRKINSSIPVRIGFILALFIHIAALVAIPEPNINEYKPSNINDRTITQQDINIQVDFQTIDEVIEEILNTEDISNDINENQGEIILSDSGDTMISSITVNIFDIDTSSLIPADTFTVSAEYVESYEIPPQPIYLQEPDYPSAALNSNLEGSVILFLYVDIDGSVTRADVINSTNPIFDDNAVEAGLKCRFKAAESAGRPVRVKIVFPVNFRLN